MKNPILSNLHKQLNEQRALYTWFRQSVEELKKGTFGKIYLTQADKNYKRYEFRLRLNLIMRSIIDLKRDIKEFERYRNKR